MPEACNSGFYLERGPPALTCIKVTGGRRDNVHPARSSPPEPRPLRPSVPVQRNSTLPRPSSDRTKDGYAADQLTEPIQRPMRLFAATRTTRDWFDESEKPPPTAIPSQTLIAWSVFGLFLMALLIAMHFVQVDLMPVVAARRRRVQIQPRHALVGTA